MLAGTQEEGQVGGRGRRAVLALLNQREARRPAALSLPKNTVIFWKRAKPSSASAKARAVGVAAGGGSFRKARASGGFNATASLLLKELSVLSQGLQGGTNYPFFFPLMLLHKDTGQVGSGGAQSKHKDNEKDPIKTAHVHRGPGQGCRGGAGHGTGL